ncbi:hypothetical protein BLNAU_16043 [Blattamonas nauphoetae]|uniref:Uncharacterized protein n=1 Tax=Blattamonas nauphoetae TaxID=2049346 RepID=A0ABQ9X8Y1_9EUKA|nr:hypothetical protein BLNAU_16043 [Blattamonas nauphoetae]
MFLPPTSAHRPLTLPVPTSQQLNPPFIKQHNAFPTMSRMVVRTVKTDNWNWQTFLLPKKFVPTFLRTEKGTARAARHMSVFWGHCALLEPQTVVPNQSERPPTRGSHRRISDLLGLGQVRNFLVPLDAGGGEGDGRENADQNRLRELEAPTFHFHRMLVETLHLLEERRGLVQEQQNEMEEAIAHRIAQRSAALGENDSAEQADSEGSEDDTNELNGEETTSTSSPSQPQPADAEQHHRDRDENNDWRVDRNITPDPWSQQLQNWRDDLAQQQRDATRELEAAEEEDEEEQEQESQSEDTVTIDLDESAVLPTQPRPLTVTSNRLLQLLTLSDPPLTSTPSPRLSVHSGSEQSSADEREEEGTMEWRKKRGLLVLEEQHPDDELAAKMMARFGAVPLPQSQAFRTAGPIPTPQIPSEDSTESTGTALPTVVGPLDTPLRLDDYLLISSSFHTMSLFDGGTLQRYDHIQRPVKNLLTHVRDATDRLCFMVNIPFTSLFLVSSQKRPTVTLAMVYSTTNYRTTPFFFYPITFLPLSLHPAVTSQFTSNPRKHPELTFPGFAYDHHTPISTTAMYAPVVPVGVTVWANETPNLRPKVERNVIVYVLSNTNHLFAWNISIRENDGVTSRKKKRE